MLLFVVHDYFVWLRQLVHRIVIAQLMGRQLLALHVRLVCALGHLAASVAVGPLNELHLLVLGRFQVFVRKWYVLLVRRQSYLILDDFP